MTKFEQIKTMNIDELSAWLDEHGQLDNSPWGEWWDEHYCKSCPSETGYIINSEGEYEWRTPCEFSWCELHNKCKFFPDMGDIPDNKDVIKMWLESEV